MSKLWSKLSTKFGCSKETSVAALSKVSHLSGEEQVRAKNGSEVLFLILTRQRTLRRSSKQRPKSCLSRRWLGIRISSQSCLEPGRLRLRQLLDFHLLQQRQLLSPKMAPGVTDAVLQANTAPPKNTPRHSTVQPASKKSTIPSAKAAVKNSMSEYARVPVVTVLSVLDVLTR